eukprot:COSAG02_NODE_8341_length_2607_cov_1.547448_3_plen_101_part_00
MQRDPYGRMAPSFSFDSHDMLRVRGGATTQRSELSSSSLAKTLSIPIAWKPRSWPTNRGASGRYFPHCIVLRAGFPLTFCVSTSGVLQMAAPLMSCWDRM